MIIKRIITLILFISLMGSTSRLAAQKENLQGFRGVLELADLGPDKFSAFRGGLENKNEDWQLMVQLWSRLRRYSSVQLTNWTKSWPEATQIAPGGLYKVVGEVVAIETLALPAEFAKLLKQTNVYRCHLRSGPSTTELIVLSANVPKLWAERDLSAGEPVRFQGVLLKKGDDEKSASTIFLTDHMAWYPVRNVSSGQKLLAQSGMDVSLLDEVLHRKPFVKPSVSRESEAFYGCMQALAKLDMQEIARLTNQNVVEVANQWRQQRELIATQYESLNEQTQVSHDELKKTRQQLALADAVIERSEAGTSSVAPLFLQPQQQVGELVRLEGIARRAVWIAESERSELEGYFELEIFTPDSQDLPIVCCAIQLPEEFPIGDEIRESVRISGIFFKSWQYRSRKLVETGGETKQQQRLYTPIVITGSPTWLTAAPHNGAWELWGGIAFLTTILVLWIIMARLARRDRQARATSRQTLQQVEQLSEMSDDDLTEIET